MFSGATNQAARRGLSLVVPVTLAAQAGGSSPRSPAEARAANPFQADQRLTVLLPRDAGSSTGDASVVSSSGAAGGGACASPIVPQATTDAITRVIFRGIRGRVCQEEVAEDGAEESRLDALERLVATAASDAGVQASIARRLEGEAGASAALDRFLMPPASSSSPALPSAGPHFHRPRLPPPLPPSPFATVGPRIHHSLPQIQAPQPLQHPHPHPHPHPHRREARNLEAAVSCSVCFLPLYEARVLDCGGGHVFCAPCVEQLTRPPSPRIPSVARFFSMVAPGDAGGSGDGSGSGGWSFFAWLFGQRRGGQQGRGRGDRGPEKRCPECRKRFTTSIPVRRINDIVDSVRTLLPGAVDEEDMAEQERRARPARRGGAKTGAGLDEPLPSSSAGAADMPAWVLTLVALVVVVAMAVGRP